MAGKLGDKPPSKPKAKPDLKVVPAANRATTPLDNKRAAEERESAQALSFVGKIRKEQTTLAEIMLKVDAQRTVINDVFTEAKGQGFSRVLLTEIIKDLNVKGKRKDLTEAEQKRRRVRSYFDLPTGEDDALPDMPLEERDRVDWQGDGYRAGLRGDDAKPPSECPQRFTQDWMVSWHEGQAKMFAASKLAKSAAAAPKPAAPAPKPDPAPEPSIAEQRLAESRETAAVKDRLGSIGAAGGMPIAPEPRTFAEGGENDEAV